MIKYKDIRAEHQSSELSVTEQTIISKMENVTDSIIKDDFGRGLPIPIPVSRIDELVDSLNTWRRPIVVAAWQSMCEASGWRIESSSESDYYYLYGKN
jgi:hypothetical protein